jgi:hypothetical protein
VCNRGLGELLLHFRRACRQPARGAFRTPYFILMKSFIFV